MGKRDELIAKYAEDLRTRCRINPDLDLLARVTLGCGPAIHDPVAESITPTDPAERETIRRNFLIRKLRLPDDPRLDEAIDAVLDICGASGHRPYRAVVYYLLTRHFGRESVYR